MAPQPLLKVKSTKASNSFCVNYAKLAPDTGAYMGDSHGGCNIGIDAIHELGGVLSEKNVPVGARKGLRDRVAGRVVGETCVAPSDRQDPLGIHLSKIPSDGQHGLTNGRIAIEGWAPSFEALDKLQPEIAHITGTWSRVFITESGCAALPRVSFYSQQ
jgi:hypothetical protein